MRLWRGYMTARRMGLHKVGVVAAAQDASTRGMCSNVEPARAVWLASPVNHVFHQLVLGWKHRQQRDALALWKRAAAAQKREAARRWYTFHHEFACARQIQRWVRERWAHFEDLEINGAATAIQCLVRSHTARQLFRRETFKARVAEYMVREAREEVMEREDRRSAVVNYEYRMWRRLDRLRRYFLVLRWRLVVSQCVPVLQLLW